MWQTNEWAAWVTAGMHLVTPMATKASQTETGGPSDRVEKTNPAQLEAQARSLFASPTRYGEAVRLFVEAADQREIGDPLRVKNLVMASRLTYYRGQTHDALHLMQRAANEAISTGDVLAAANSYMDSAFLAQELGHTGVAAEMMKKAERLSYSPLLAQEDRDYIRNRLSNGA